MWGWENEWFVRERKNKKYEPITNPASKTSNVEQGVEMSTVVTDNMVRLGYFVLKARAIGTIHIHVLN